VVLYRGRINNLSVGAVVMSALYALLVHYTIY
jgi:hypothetical protein